MVNGQHVEFDKQTYMVINLIVMLRLANLTLDFLKSTNNTIISRSLKLKRDIFQPLWANLLSALIETGSTSSDRVPNGVGFKKHPLSPGEVS